MTIGGVISNITHFLVLISFWKWVLLFQNDFFFSFSELVNEELFFLIVNKKINPVLLIVESNKTTRDSIKTFSYS